MFNVDTESRRTTRHNENTHCCINVDRAHCIEQRKPSGKSSSGEQDWELGIPPSADSTSQYTVAQEHSGTHLRLAPGGANKKGVSSTGVAYRHHNVALLGLDLSEGQMPFVHTTEVEQLHLSHHTPRCPPVQQGLSDASRRDKWLDHG